MLRKSDDGGQLGGEMEHLAVGSKGAASGMGVSQPVGCLMMRDVV